MVEPSEELQVVFDKAIKDAKRLEHEYVTLEHLLFAITFDSLIQKVNSVKGDDIKKQFKSIQEEKTKAITDLMKKTEKL